jgi:hypothetical protein
VAFESKAAKYCIEDRVKEIKIANRLIRDIEGYHIHVCPLAHILNKAMTVIKAKLN